MDFHAPLLPNIVARTSSPASIYAFPPQIAGAGRTITRPIFSSTSTTLQTWWRYGVMWNWKTVLIMMTMIALNLLHNDPIIFQPLFLFL